MPQLVVGDPRQEFAIGTLLAPRECGVDVVLRDLIPLERQEPPSRRLGDLRSVVDGSVSFSRCLVL